MVEQSHDARPIVVLSAPGPDATAVNPFITMLCRSIDADGSVEFRRFSWVRGLTSRFDVLHLHWPEYLVRGERISHRIAIPFLVVLLRIRLLVQRPPVVWTMHNIRPHESLNRLESLLMRILLSAVTARVHLSETSVELYGDPLRPEVVIPIGHYGPVIAPFAAKLHEEPAEPVYDLVSFGELRPYKRLEDLIAAFSATDSVARLRIVGACYDEAYADRIAELAAAVPGISYEPGYLSDERLAIEIVRGEIVVLPYSQLFNSAAAVLALTLRRPLVLPRTPSTMGLVEEFGSEWVQLFDGALDGPALNEAVANLRELADKRETGPDLSAREWDSIGAAYRGVYRGES